MIEHHNRCVGLRLFRLGRWQVELWLCPAREFIPLHRHPGMTAWIFNLWGRMRWRVGKKERQVWGPFRLRKSTGRPALAFHRITPRQYHGADVFSCSAFLTIERWNKPPTSAARNIVYA